MRSSNEVIKEINEFQPIEGNWLKLDSLLDELWETEGGHQRYAEDLLRIFERFPEEDGAGVFWTIVHAVETVDNYEQELFQSLTRQPSEMGLVMLKRIANTGQKAIGEFEIKNIVDSILSDSRTAVSIKDKIKNWFQWT